LKGAAKALKTGQPFISKAISGCVKRTLACFLFSVLIHGAAAAQDLRLEIAVPRVNVKSSEPINLTIRLLNVSEKSYYVAGAISLGSFGVGHEYGWYELQVRKRGASDFVPVPGVAADRFSRGPQSTAEILVENRLVLLEANEYSRMFVGKTINSNWRGLTLLEPGRYSIRVAFKTYGDRTVVPKDLRYPIFLQPLVSNVLDIDVRP
jgi:hypothetical protein